MWGWNYSHSYGWYSALAVIYHPTTRCSLCLLSGAYRSDLICFKVFIFDVSSLRLTCDNLWLGQSGKPSFWQVFLGAPLFFIRYRSDVYISWVGHLKETLLPLVAATLTGEGGLQSDFIIPVLQPAAHSTQHTAHSTQHTATAHPSRHEHPVTSPKATRRTTT